MKRWVMLCTAAISLLVAASLYSATSGSSSGPRRFREWQPPVSDPSKRTYGDPSWARRMRERRLMREKIAAGRTDLAATLRSDKFSLPVLLGNFSDQTNIKTREEFQTVLFGDNPTGSMIDFYREISYDQFELSGTVFGWYDSDKDKAYYVDKNAPYEFVRDIVAKADADPTMNFAQFDNDGPDGAPNSGDDDGYVDAVYVICPGIEDNEAFHAHMWTLGSSGLGEYETNDPAIGGGMIKINTYAITEELNSVDDQTYEVQPIGTLCHEFGHILGLPDLYDRTGDEEAPDFKSSEGLGQWCLMGSGNYGADGSTPSRPVHMSAWCKLQMGWLSPTVVSANGPVSLTQVETNPAALKIWENSYHSFRYFLIENRQAAGFDSNAPSPGLLIYHVDESRTWDLNEYAGPGNDDYRIKLVDLEEADGLDNLDNGDNRSDDGDPFPGASGNRTFDDSSTPNSRDREGNSTGIAIREISDPGETMTALVTLRSDNGYTLAYDEKGMNEFFTYSGANNWVGVHFRAEQAGRLEALVLGVSDEEPRDFQVRIYDGLSGGIPGNLLTSQSFNAQGQSWQTITLDNPLELIEGAEFFVSVTGMASFGADGKGTVSDRTYFSNNGTSFSPLIGLSGPVDYPLRALIRTSSGTVEPTENLFSDAIHDCTFTTTTGFYDLWVDVEPSQTGATVYLIAGTNEGASFPDTVVCTASGNRYTGKLAALPGGSHYYFYFEARSADGFLHTMPLYTPANYYTLTVDATVSPTEPLFSDAIHDCTFTTTTGFYDLWVDVEPSQTGATVYLIAGTNEGASFPDTVVCTASGNRYTGKLAALPGGSHYYFYFEARSADGFLHTMPLYTPANYYTLTVDATVSPTEPLFSDAIHDCTFTTTTGFYDLWVDVEPSQTGATVYLIAGTNEGASFPDTVVCTRSGNRYTGKLPALTGDSHYYFYFEGRSSDGFLHTMPLYVPANYYTLTVDAPKPLFTKSIGNTSFSSTSGYYQLWADVDPSYAVMTVKLIARKNSSAGFTDTVACTRSGNRFTGQLAAMPTGSSYSFFFQAVESNGTQHRLPENAPTGLYTASVSASGDLDGNGKTDVFDLLSMLKVLSGAVASGQGSDLNNDGKIDVFDLLAMLKKLAQ